MIWKPTFAATALVAAMNLIGAAFAGADDYVFETVKSEIKSSNVARRRASGAQAHRQAGY